MTYKASKYYLPGGLYSKELIEAIGMVVFLGLVKPIELKKYLEGNKDDTYNILCELIKANAPAYRAKRQAS